MRLLLCRHSSKTEETKYEVKYAIWKTRKTKMLIFNSHVLIWDFLVPQSFPDPERQVFPCRHLFHDTTIICHFFCCGQVIESIPSPPRNHEPSTLTLELQREPVAHEPLFPAIVAANVLAKFPFSREQYEILQVLSQVRSHSTHY